MLLWSSVIDRAADSAQQRHTMRSGDWEWTGVMPALLFWVRFHSFHQYSIPCSAWRDHLLWSGEWRSAGASLLPLIRALCSSAPWGVKVKAQRKKKKKDTLCVAPTPVFHCAFQTWKGVVYRWLLFRWLQRWNGWGKKKQEKVKFLLICRTGCC